MNHLHPHEFAEDEFESEYPSCISISQAYRTEAGRNMILFASGVTKERQRLIDLLPDGDLKTSLVESLRLKGQVST